MPLCPKCHKEISARRFQRHLQRCGTSHRHYTGELYVPSATPAWERPDRGILVGPPGTKPRRGHFLIYALLTVALGGLVIWGIGMLAHL